MMNKLLSIFSLLLIIIINGRNKNSSQDVLFAVVLDGKWGYVNVRGEYIVEPQFDEAIEFYGNLARIKINDKYGFIDKTGKIVINPQFDNAHLDEGCFATVKLNDKWGYIDKFGKIIINPQFEEPFFSQKMVLLLSN